MERKQFEMSDDELGKMRDIIESKGPVIKVGDSLGVLFKNLKYT